MNLRALRARIKEFRARSLAGALADFSLSLAVYLGAFYGALALSAAPLRAALGFGAGVAAGSLFMMGHDACHGSYTPLPTLNRVLGRIAFLPSYQAYSLWDLSHNRTHHIYTNLKGRDFVWLPLSKPEFDALPLLRRLVYRLHRTPLGLALYYPMDIWLPRIFFPRRAMVDRPRLAYTLDSLLVLGFILLQVAATIVVPHRGFGGWAASALYALLVPWLVFSWMIGFVIYFNHTHPRVPWFDKKEDWSAFSGTIHGTLRLRFPRWTRLFASNIMDHVAHHVDPRIPLVRLSDAEDAIEALLPGQVVVETWSIGNLRGILRCCKLYDYGAHRWTDYEGRPTSERWLPEEARRRGSLAIHVAAPLEEGPDLGDDGVVPVAERDRRALREHRG